MKSILALLSITLLIGLSSCDEPTKQATTKNKSDFTNSGLIKEVIQTSNYTYCFVADDQSEYWVAIAKMEVTAGQTLYFNQGLQMKDFHSKELDRTFPSVFFVQKASTEPTDASIIPQMTQQPVKPKIEKNELTVEKAEGGITIAELYANKAKYANQKVKIRGKVTKFNTAIMSKNWAHIQDGTDYDGNFDLTVTTVDEVNIDAVVTFEGIIAIDKDFGSGYSYSIIMEEAIIVK
ncbi:MAG: SH3-like domain-containing protein [Bacteroidetes bacterium]|nr:SH3-like domain-containing protein [Bacteroidota bacterium]